MSPFAYLLPAITDKVIFYFYTIVRRRLYRPMLNGEDENLKFERFGEIA